MKPLAYTLIASFGLVISGCKSTEPDATPQAATATADSDSTNAGEPVGETAPEKTKTAETDAAPADSTMSYIYAEDPPGDDYSTWIKAIDGNPVDVEGETKIPITPGKHKLNIGSGSRFQKMWKRLNVEIEPGSVYKVVASRSWNNYTFKVEKVGGGVAAEGGGSMGGISPIPGGGIGGFVPMGSY